MGFGDSEQILIVSMMGTGGGMAVFVVMMYFTFSRDQLTHTDKDIEKQFRMKMYMGLIPAMGIGTVLIISGLVPPVLAVGLAGIPLLYPGIMAKKEESRISSYTEWYPMFILHFGQLYSTTGAMGTALQAVMRSNFGAIQTHITALKNRIKNRIDQVLAFNLFSIDSGNHLIANGNDIFSTSVDKGSDMNIVGNVISDVTKKVSELRGKRAQNASTFQLIVIILHILSLGIFGLMNKLTDMFNGLSQGDLANAAFELSPVDPELMAALMPILLIMTSVISGFAIKVIQGGMYKTVFFHIGLLLTIGGVAMFAISLFMEEFLNGIVFTAPVPGI
jgi:flagellar protein FlaJ